MGTKMTIEEAKEILKAYDFSFTGCTGSLKEAISTVLPVVEKYQKIQEVMDSRPDDDAKSNSKALGEIEVVMYGNDD